MKSLHIGLGNSNLPVLLVSILLLLTSLGCGGATGGAGGPSSDETSGNGGGDPKKDFILIAAAFARPISDVSGNLIGVVNPASVFEVDPITNVPLPTFPKVLVPGTSLGSLASLNFEQILDTLTPQIPLIPRNAALVLQFSQPIKPESLLLSDEDAATPGLITSASTVQIRRKDGSIVPARASVDGSKLIILGVVGDSVGFDPSPLVFNSFGNAVEDPVGYFQLVLGVGAGTLLSTTGLALVPRQDKLGTVAVPLPLNPGNSSLDAIVLQTESGVVSFNGFLPDLTAPRLIRPVETDGLIELVGIASDGGQQVLEITAAPMSSPPNVLANGGLGEWASGRMDVTGIGNVVSSYVIHRNYAQALPPNKPVFQLAPGTTLDPSVVVGSTFTVLRSEFFEPIPPPLPNDSQQLAKVTVDPINHPRDPFDPQDDVNHEMRYFVRMFDENGLEQVDRWNPATGLFLAVSPKSELRLTFSEPMDLASFRPYENFYVTDLTQPKSATAFGSQRIGQPIASSDSRSISFIPSLENQQAPETAGFIGFGGTPSSLKLVLRTIPEKSQIDALKANASQAQLSLLHDLGTSGVLGINDLGGRGLGLPQALLDQGNTTQFLLQPTSVASGPFPPAVDFELAFQTMKTTDPDYGAIVHRFMGQATTSSFTYPNGSVHDTVTSGVEYADHPAVDTNGDSVVDQRFIYGPQTFDIALNLPGKLAGAGAQTIQHLIDDFNKPKVSPYSSPNGEDTLKKLGFGLSTPLNSPFGCRFQHIYRAGDASPSYNDFNGVILDLVGLAWSPLNDTVSNTVISDMEILVGLSGAGMGQGPSNETGDNGIPDSPESGLKQQFDCNLLEWAENCCLISTFPEELPPYVSSQPSLTPVVASGTPYPIVAGSLFKPQNAGAPGTFNMWINYPTFNSGVDPIFGKSTTKSFPYDSRFPMLIEYRLDPAQSVYPSTNNFYRFSPGVLSSALPRFRIWSQGQDPLAHSAPNFTLGASMPSGVPCTFKAGEGGPLVEPGTFISDILPPTPNNGMPVIKASTYQLPPKVNCVDAQLPKPDLVLGALPGPPIVLPKSNTDPNTNWYYADGQLAYPLPNTGCFPGPKNPGQKTANVGYGVDGICTAGSPLNVNEPNYQCNPGRYGDNSRYFMLWQYRKRVSIIESPTLFSTTPSGMVEYQVPIIQPPLSAVDPLAGLIIEVRAGTELDFSIPVLESGYISVSDPDFVSKVSGENVDRQFVKFRASFAVAPGQFQPPYIDTIIIPYRKVAVP